MPYGEPMSGFTVSYSQVQFGVNFATSGMLTKLWGKYMYSFFRFKVKQYLEGAKFVNFLLFR